MTVQAHLSDASIVVSPGGEETVRLVVRNIGPAAETLAIVPSGLCAGWVAAHPASLELMPDEERAVTITLRPPRTSTVASGDSVLALRVVPHGRPSDVVVVEATVTVLAFASRRLVIAQPVQIAARRAVYDVVLENHGNQQASVRLSMTDMSGRLVGRFDPPSLGIDPGQSAACRLKVRARGRRWFGHARSTRFTVEAEQDGQQAAIAGATFVQSPIATSRAIGALAVIVAPAAVVVGAWSLVVRPAIDDAARDAVTNLTTDTATPVPTTLADDTGSDTGSDTIPGDTATSTPDDTTTPTPGGIVNTRLPVSVATGDTGRNAIDAGDTPLSISDIVVQNPAADLGILTISVSGQVLFTFDLETVYGYEQVELQTPVVIAAGERFVVDVQCDAPGDPSAAECSPAVFVSGRIG